MDGLDRIHDLRHLEWFSRHFAQPFRRHEVGRPQQMHELPGVQLGDENPPEPLQQLAEVARERVQVAEVNVRNVEPNPTTATAPSSSPSATRWGGMSFAIPAIFAARARVIRAWLSGS